MKKIILACFPALLCLFGSNLFTQIKVVESLPEQEGAISSAHRGAIIYGEFINPDSLSPIQIRFESYLLMPGKALQQTQLDVKTDHGTFFDGVLDPRVRKFNVSLPFTSDFAYFSLSVKGRVLLEDFLISSDDSVKINVNLENATLLFAGPKSDWFEVQYQIARAKQQVRFDSPRTLVQSNPEEFLDQKDYRAQWERANSDFGARLNIAGFGSSGIQSRLEALNIADYGSIPGFEVLEDFKDQLEFAQYSALKVDLIGKYFASKISSFRKYQLVTPAALGDSLSVAEAEALLPELNKSLRHEIEKLKPTMFSVGYNQFLFEWVKLKSMETGESWQELVVQEFEGEIKDKLLTSFVEEELAKGYFTTGYLDQILPKLNSEPWKSHLDSLQRRLKLGVELESVKFETLEGKNFSLDEFEGMPTLLYFYFSTCAHSANYFNNYLWPIYQETAKQAGYRLVAVSVDDDQKLWKSSLGRYSDPSLLNLNLSQTANQNWLDYYLVDAFPRTMLIDAKGNLLSLNLTGEDYESYKANLLKLLSTPVSSTTSNKTF
jgi:cytochrome oxidase Cu insertion factor (SCO1/SenC/PrrC family)